MPDTSAYRKCHVCDHLTGEVGGVARCGGCGRFFAPFYYYDDRATPTVEADAVRPALPPPGEWVPVRGLTAYWGD